LMLKIEIVDCIPIIYKVPRYLFHFLLNDA
jgi:hypothetical protein